MEVGLVVGVENELEQPSRSDQVMVEAPASCRLPSLLAVNLVFGRAWRVR